MPELDALYNAYYQKRDAVLGGDEATKQLVFAAVKSFEAWRAMSRAEAIIRERVNAPMRRVESASMGATSVYVAAYELWQAIEALGAEMLSEPAFSHTEPLMPASEAAEYARGFPSWESEPARDTRPEWEKRPPDATYDPATGEWTIGRQLVGQGGVQQCNCKDPNPHNDGESYDVTCLDCGGVIPNPNNARRDDSAAWFGNDGGPDYPGRDALRRRPRFGR